MSKMSVVRRAMRKALGATFGNRQTGMLATGAKKMARREASALKIEEAAVLTPDRARASKMKDAALRLRTTTRARIPDEDGSLADDIVRGGKAVERTGNAGPVSAVKPRANEPLAMLRRGDKLSAKQIYELRLSTSGGGMSKADMALLAKAEKAAKRKWNPATASEE